MSLLKTACRRGTQFLLLLLLLPTVPEVSGQNSIRQVQGAPDPTRAVLQIHPDQRAGNVIPREITGKFAEHLGNNLVNGMDAQVLRNPTFAEYPLPEGGMTPDGVMKFLVNEEEIGRRLRQLAERHGWPAEEISGMVHARSDSLATFWTRVGEPTEVEVSPDTGPYGGRAQRVKASTGKGIGQWTYLPLHRTRRFEVELMVRSPDVSALRLELGGPRTTDAHISVEIAGITSEWRKFAGLLTVPNDWDSEKSYKFSVVCPTNGTLVLRHVFLRPADHVNGADPDVIRFLKVAHLPLLRWPGGNFVSGYHWEDGVGPLERRPTLPNYAWGEIEPNLFGTDEFIAFCRAVGCEPMICINAGNGTPAEAARWVEYCNGAASSPMGRLRAANGHAESYNVKHWEVGNELWGKWQFNWTTAEGYADRYNQFSRAMREVDPSVELQACGAPVFWGKSWNNTVIRDARGFSTITDHALIGGEVQSSADPLQVYLDFLAVPEVLQQKWAGLREDMLRGGISEPRLAITELQLFPSLGRGRDGENRRRLTNENLVRPQMQAEALYDILIYHAAIRLGNFVEMVTHSAVVNHGGGLRKIRERVFANPCQYAQAEFSRFAEARPVKVDISAGMEEAPRVLPQLRDATPAASISTLDALAAVDPKGSLLISIVERGTNDAPIETTIDLGGFEGQSEAELCTLSADVPWAMNTLEQPEKIKPVLSKALVKDGRIILSLKPYSWTRVVVPKR